MLKEPYKGDGNYIFISYSHKDMKEVLAFIESLQDNGYNVWYDEGIDPGTEWDDNIAMHIKDCSYFISYLTNNYIASQNCKDELNYARDLDKERLLIYGEEIELPEGMKMRMNRLQAIFKYKYIDKTKFYSKVFQAEGIEKCKVGSTAETVPTSIGDEIKTEQSPDKKKISPIMLIVLGAVILGIILIAVFALGNNNDSSKDAGNSAATEESVTNDSTEAEATESSDEYYSDSNPDKGTKYTKEASWPDPDFSSINMDTTEMQTVIDRPEMKFYRVCCLGHSITVKGTCTGGYEFGIFVFSDDGVYEKTLVEKRSNDPINIQFNETVQLEEDGYHWVKVQGVGPYDVEWEGIY